MSIHRLTHLQITHLRNDLSEPYRGAGIVRMASLGALASLALVPSGCIEDTDCGICDADNLILQSISGPNYQGSKIHVLNPTCQGPDCPAPLSSGAYFVDEIIECTETEEARASVDAEEFCRFSPLVTRNGLEFIFNNLLEPTSIELVRKRPDNPRLFEVYDWKPDVLQIDGPITRFNGDYNRGQGSEPDTITRLVNLSCIDNLAAQGQSFSAADYADPATNPCNAVNPATGLPMKLFAGGTVKAARGIWRQGGNSCSTPTEGPDTCCDYCEHLLSTQIARYGVDADGVARNPNDGLGPPDAIRCAEAGDGVVDRYVACADFIASVDRSDEEQTWEYEWCAPGTLGPDCALEVQQFRVPLFDKLRETHPDLRPAGLENRTATCSSTAECSSRHDLTGTECMGTHVDTGATCLADAYDDDGTCIDAVCRPEWMVTCAFNEDTTGPDEAYCTDRRFADNGTAACFVATEEVANETLYGAEGPDGAGFSVGCDPDGTNCAGQGGPGAPMSLCDWNENGRVTATECCQDSLNGPNSGQSPGFACDPYSQQNLAPIPNYDRDPNLPDQTERCLCPLRGDLDSNRASLEEDGCLEAAERGCYDNNGELVPGREGQYAVKFVARVGGVVYDPALKGFVWRPADRGSIPRADIEACAEAGRFDLVGELNRHDGWRAASAPNSAENYEDYDRAMCSGQTYQVRFNTPGNEDNPAFVVDKADNTLAGKSVYEFETAQFHVEFDSGRPKDNIRIGACGDFSLAFSNKYDASPENLEKLTMVRIRCDQADPDGSCSIVAPDPRCDDANPPADACCEAGAPVAGGPGCLPTQDQLAEAQRDDVCAAPCLTVDIAEMNTGRLTVQIDPVEFDDVLQKEQTYRLSAPSVASQDQALSDPAAYANSFWDACGMPLVTGNVEPYDYQFTIDPARCEEDADGDGIPLSCDNDSDTFFSPNQSDLDRDGLGDVVDKCPLIAGSSNDATADSDLDGVGNNCDTCRQALTAYNGSLETAPDYMQVRSIPDQSDFDNDGIGDVCDNCVITPNCEDYGDGDGLEPFELGDPIAFDDNDFCQSDADASGIGDACEGQTLTAFAAGPVGLGDDDDFDQDGIPNLADFCPRQPLGSSPVTCTPETEETDCGPARVCTDGVCNHLDTDGDRVGDICDTCAFAPNPNQTIEGGTQEDDPDGDFVGDACEIGVSQGCGDNQNARPFGFYTVAASGSCCTTQLVAADQGAVERAAARGLVMSVGDLLLAATCTDPADLSSCQPLTAMHPEFPDARDADGVLISEIPIRTTEFCSEAQVEAFECAQLPTTVETAPGVLTAPPGCDDALAEAGTSALENLLQPLTDADFADAPNPLDALWQTVCFLPQVDQDYDGIADVCDKCIFAFDPSNASYVSETGRLFSNAGAACNGDLAPDAICEVQEAELAEDGAETDGDGATGGETGGAETEG